MNKIQGRMITKDISSDERLWEELDGLDRWLFPFVIPHLEIDGSLDRNARLLRLTCFPCAKISDKETESMIKKWIFVELCEEKNERLFFIDFDRCNYKLDAIRQRRHRTLVINRDICDKP